MIDMVNSLMCEHNNAVCPKPMWVMMVTADCNVNSTDKASTWRKTI